MAAKISLDRVAELYDYVSSEELLLDYTFEPIAPACCDEGCEVEQDGTCPHGHPSIFVEAGLV